MKKILLFLLFTVSFTTVSYGQIPAETTVFKPLLLNNVPAGTNDADVLVRGTDKIVKSIPRSEFGGSPNLQQVYDRYATDVSDPNTKIIIGSVTNSSSFFRTIMSLESSEGGLANMSYFADSPSGSIGLSMNTRWGFNIGGTRKVDGYQYNYSLIAETPPNLTANYSNSFVIPWKFNPSKYTYYLATLEDLEAMITEKGTVTGDQTLKLESTDHISSVNINNKEISIINAAGKVYLRNQALSFSSGGKCIQLNQSPTQPSSSQLFVDMPDESGQLAIKSDFAFASSATSPISASSLNSTWTNKPNGFQVQCKNMSGGAVIYVKTSSGWLQYSATIVP